jgi:uncharacterized protein YwqG
MPDLYRPPGRDIEASYAEFQELSEFMTNHNELKLKLREAGLGHVDQDLAGLARPCFRVRRTLVDEKDIAVAASKLGGFPDLPAGFVWPEVTSRRKHEAMEFVAQIRLSDLPRPLPEPVPQDGLLSFFTHWSEGRVFYFPEGTSLLRTAGPNAPIEPAPRGFWQNLRTGFTGKAGRRAYRAATVSFEPAVSPADGTSSLVGQLKLSEVDAETYIELCEASWDSGSGDDVVKHQMFGHATTVQNEMELGCNFQRLQEKPRWDLPPEQVIAAARDWVLLLQLDSDDSSKGPGWMWGDLGIVYFWIHREDLARRAFDRAIAIEQCH